jgi:hypothetical protein
MKNSILGTILLGALSASAWMTGCAVDPQPAQPERIGQVAVELQVAPGIALASVEYTITGPLGFSRRGRIDVSNSSTISAVIAAIPFGVGYQIALRATTTDRRGTCMGASTFDIDGPSLRAVPIHMTSSCSPAPAAS